MVSVDSEPKLLFVSVPMTGRKLADIKADMEWCRKKVEELTGEKYVVADTLFPNGDRDPLGALANALVQMSKSDAIFFAPGWEASRGCRFEDEISGAYAGEYGIKQIFYTNKSRDSIWTGSIEIEEIQEGEIPPDAEYRFY